MACDTARDTARAGLLGSGYFEMALGTSIFATSSILVRFVDLPAPLIVFFRFSLAVPALLLYALASGRLQSIHAPRDRWLALFLGAASSLTFTSFIVGLQYTSVANTNFLFFVSPVITPFLAHKLIGEKIEPNAVVALCLAFLGVVLIGYPKLGTIGGRETIGMAVAFAGGCLASATTVTRKMIGHAVPSATIAIFQYATATLCVLPLILLTTGSRYAITPTALLVLATLGIFNTGVGGLLTIDAIGKIAAQDAAVLRYVEPVGAIILAWLLLAEVPPVSTMLGGSLILLSGYLVMRQAAGS